jgi:hypothetical protein
MQGQLIDAVRAYKLADVPLARLILHAAGMSAHVKQALLPCKNQPAQMQCCMSVQRRTTMQQEKVAAVQPRKYFDTTTCTTQQSNACTAQGIHVLFISLNNF